MLAIFVKRCRTDTVQLAARERWLQQLARADSTFALARANNCVEFINKKNNATFARGNFTQNCFESFLKFTAEFRSCQ